MAGVNMQSGGSINNAAPGFHVAGVGPIFAKRTHVKVTGGTFVAEDAANADPRKSMVFEGPAGELVLVRVSGPGDVIEIAIGADVSALETLIGASEDPTDTSALARAAAELA